MGIRIPIEELEQFYYASLLALGVSSDGAERGARGIGYADRHGFDSHGAINFKRIYYSQLRSKQIDPTASPSLLRDGVVTALVDGNNALGYHSADYGVRLAMQRAQFGGVGAVGVRRSSHCGCMGYYAREAALQGYLCIALTNLGAQAILRPPGGSQKLVGTNVFAAAAPCGSEPPFVLDMSTAVVSTGQLRVRVERDQEIPRGWLKDDLGNDVQDPRRYFDGTAFLQFLGGCSELGALKGFGLGVLIDMLCGALLDGGVGANEANLSGESIRGRYDGGIGHFFIVIDPQAFAGASTVMGRLEEMAKVIQSCPPTGTDPVFYAGVREFRIAEQRKQMGIPLSTAVCSELEEISRELSVGFPPYLASLSRAVNA